MLSILIPVYNFNVLELVKSLDSQAQQVKIDFEIIVIDDDSREKYKKINRQVAKIQHVRYLEEKTNLGRSRIRNKLADISSYQYLLFVDCDSKVQNNDYISKYLGYCGNDVVICGGRSYMPEKPADSSYYLRWLHGIKREQFSAEERNAEPNKSFMTNNFLISKTIFNRIRFDETITSYGHEDTLFGYELKKNNIIINHIDNPLIHMGLESNEEFIRKTKEGVNNLKQILAQNGYEKVFIRDITLLHWFKLLQKLGITRFLKFVFRKSEKKLFRYLVNNKPRLLFFDFYKLGYLCSIN
jgi:glycosyltransferase involved in cell wall biosynthesis